MKQWLTFLLLLITLAGTFFPCCLSDGCNDEEVAAAHKENKQQPEGNCSPFFACATCPGFAALSKPIQIIEPVVEKPVHHEQTVNYILPSYSPAFWQPPRCC